MTVDIAYYLPAEKLVVVRFTQNDEMVQAFRLAQSKCPRGWKNRGRVAWQLWPIDEAYGDPLMCGYLFAQWGKRSEFAKVVRKVITNEEATA